MLCLRYCCQYFTCCSVRFPSVLQNRFPKWIPLSLSFYLLSISLSLHFSCFLFFLLFFSVCTFYLDVFVSLHHLIAVHACIYWNGIVVIFMLLSICPFSCGKMKQRKIVVHMFLTVSTSFQPNNVKRIAFKLIVNNNNNNNNSNSSEIRWFRDRPAI